LTPFRSEILGVLVTFGRRISHLVYINCNLFLSIWFLFCCCCSIAL